METFAKRITRLRRLRQLTQKQVAQDLGVPLSTYKEWEYGRSIQGEQIYVRLAEIFQVNVRFLLIGQDTESPNSLVLKLERAIVHLEEVKATLISL